MRVRWGWWLAAFCICALVLVPVLTVAAAFTQPVDETWAHFSGHMLGELIVNTLRLLAPVLLITATLGIGFAWLTAAYDFPGRAWLEWLLILPFAFPTYVLGYVFLDIFGISGPVQTSLRDWFGQVPSFYPGARSVFFVALVMGLAFYPYVYLLARSAFRTHGRASLEAAQSLGHGPVAGFFKIVLPMSRPWIMGGLLLVTMETLADFGTVSIFNYDTFTTAIYKAWFSMYSLNTATKLASMLLLIALGVMALEHWTRRSKRYHAQSVNNQRLRLKPVQGWCATIACLTLLAFSFGMPLLRLLIWSVQTWQQEANSEYLTLLWNTLSIGLMAAAMITLCAVILAYARRILNHKLGGAFAALATTGYALPGTVLAVGVYIPLAWLDHRLLDLLQVFGIDLRVLLSGTLLAMLIAYLIRFLAVAFQPVQAALDRVHRNLDESAQSLGHSQWSILRHIHLPLLRSGMVGAMLLVLIDVMKEMPMTLMTRPMQWNTLAVRIFELTSEGEYERAALPSMILVATGLLPVLLLGRYSEEEKRS